MGTYSSIWKVCLLVLGISSVGSHQQRVAPGVPPQQYQGQQQGMGMQPGQMQQVPHQQQQQIHQQQLQQQQLQQQQLLQQQQIQQQQLLQQQQQQMHMQQVPVQQGHVQQGHVPVVNGVPQPHLAGQQILNAANIAHEKDHIKEHMEVPLDTSNMSEQELQFHYFKMHDADNNNKLDGCELIKSLIHWHAEQGHHDPNAPPDAVPPPDQAKIFKDEELVALIDPILNMDDFNSDGFIDYPEFVRAQQKAAAGAARQ